METSVRIRFGYLTLVVGSLLGILGLLLRGPVPLPNMDIESWSSGVTSSNYFLAQVLTIFAYVIPYVGFWAIYARVAMIEKVERAAFWGFMSSIVGTSLAIATLGVFSFVSPRLAELYLQGNEQLPNIIIEVATGQPAIINILGGTLYLLGTVLLGIAIWRSGLHPKWAGALIALHCTFLIFGFMYFPVLLLSWVFLFFAGMWLFFSMSN